ncbi:MAG: hypothetical protein RIM23_22415 [Coleofasciculus sp. G3-WIS-01]|uniref:hypothetical protein n=1 Tax=Coleofasciculus sp. G3-WIS-01 TaxID=3069528 RepID=UPI0032F32D1E
MANYTEWNQALISYFLKGVPRGSKIYLSVDDDVLDRIGQGFFLTLSGSDNWSDDFQEAIRKAVIVDKQVNLNPIQGRDENDSPNCVAFLGACVLTAYRMANEEEISQLNYFKRLREILPLPGSLRPQGMKSGKEAEEPLWKAWNYWLWEQGFQPSAYPGRGSQKYINYPISQCLLRQADKDKLQVLFATKQWTVPWDAQTLLTQIRREPLSHHLRELVMENKQRTEIVAEVIHEVYQQWQVQGCPATPNKVGHTWSPNLFAGLYRTEDPFFGQVDYYLYPKQQRGRQLESVQVEYENGTQALSEERPGWYLPIGNPLRVDDLEQGLRCSVTSPPELDQLILPARDFWLLIPDAENPDSGVYASWGTPALGTPFILLCKQELLNDIYSLQDERLLAWSGEPQPIAEDSNWVELTQCLVTSQAYDGVSIDNQTLKDALQPTVRLSISFSGGLRVPNQRGWLEGHPPHVTVFGFAPRVELEVSNLLNEQVIVTRSQKTNQPLPLKLPGTGLYLVRATYGNESAERLVRILDWNSLEVSEPERREFINIGDKYSVCGSIIMPIP